MAYDINFRKEALDYCKRGWTDQEVCDTLEISRQTLTNWKKLLFTTGSLNKKRVIRKSTGPYKYKTELLKQLLDQKNTSSESIVNVKNEKSDYQESNKKKQKKKKKNTFIY